MRTVKSCVDNKPPPTFTHIGGNNSKKQTADAGTGCACGQRARATRKTLELRSRGARELTRPAVRAAWWTCARATLARELIRPAVRAASQRGKRRLTPATRGC